LLYFDGGSTRENARVTSEAKLDERGFVVAEISGEIDAANNQLDEELRVILDRSESQIVVDLTNVTFIDSSVVRALVVAHRTVLQRGGWVRVVYTHHLIGRVINICGLEGIFPQYASVESAVRGASTVHAHGGNEWGGS
jgi:anti-anti-sigma factor